MKTTLEKIEEAHEYMKQWVREEGFDDLGIMYWAGDTELLAHSLVEAGAIDSQNCYPEFKDIEEFIESLSDKFRKLTQESKSKRIHEAFKNTVTIQCTHCHHVQFPDESNFKLYEDELRKACWECGSKKIDIQPWSKR